MCRAPGQLVGLGAGRITFGAGGLVASQSHDAARTYGRIGAVVYVGLVVLAFVTPHLCGLVPIGGHVIRLHAVLALGLAWAGFFAQPSTVRQS